MANAAANAHETKKSAEVGEGVAPLAPCSPVILLAASLRFCISVVDMLIAGDSFEKIGTFIVQHDLRPDRTVH